MLDDFDCFFVTFSAAFWACTHFKKITKIDVIGNQYIYGNCENINDVIPKTYKFNGLFYERKDTKTIYIVEND